MSNDPVNPAYYNGREVAEQMIRLFGKTAYINFCRINAYKYRARAGKKAGNPIEQDIAKALWYENEADEITRQLEAQQ